MTHNTLFGITLFLFVASGCTYQYAQEATHSLAKQAGFSQISYIERSRNIAFDSKNSFHITGIANDSELKEFPEIAEKLDDALSRYAQAVSVEDQPGRFEDSMAYARSNRIDFLIVLKLIEFHSGVSSIIEIDQRFRDKRSFGFDRIKMQIQIWDVNEENIIDSTYISSKTPFFQFTRFDAVDLLSTMFDDYSQTLFHYQSAAN